MILGKITRWTVLLGITRRTNNRGGIKTITSAGVTNINQLFQFTSWNFIRTMASGSSPKHKNRLADEKSPYLLQHAHNPVEWYPWSEEAFEAARRESKVIFLSVGYSTCHWCHVMERESFENEEIAKLMNEFFINIKVDREERPDVDKIYMTFVQATTGGGGWPMSVWLTPDLTPIYGGTYFPPDDRYYGRPGFKSVLKIIYSQWNDNQSKFSETGQKVLEALKKGTYLDPISSPIPQISAVNKCFQQMAQSFEPKFGGFGEAPKFPQPVNLNFLFHAYSRDQNSEMGKKALEMSLFTLKMMAKGGMHDHVAQGFARYSTDEKWHVPHFEKMLYDQAQLAVSYSNAYIATKEEFFSDVVRDILTYVDRDLGHELGGFYSAEDADSFPDHSSTHKREGAFCVWTFGDIKRLLSKPVEGRSDLTLSDVFCHHYNVKQEGNVNPYQDPHDELKDQNVLIVFGSEEETAAHFNITIEEAKSLLKESCQILFAERLKRPRPHLDDKILTAWNGLMISGFSKASQALQDEAYLQRAVKAANFIKKHLYDTTSKTLLRSCYRDEEGNIVQISSPILGFLDDYAFVIQGLLDLYESSLDSTWIEWAEILQETQNSLFWDIENAGYFTSPSTDGTTVLRLKEDQDGAEPSGNSVACCNLQRLGALLDRDAWRDQAGKILSVFTTRLNKLPMAVPQMASALALFHDTPTQVYIAGRRSDPETEALLRSAQTSLIPGRILALVDPDHADPEVNVITRRCDSARSMRPQRGRPAAFVCRRRSCSLPVTSPEQLHQLLFDT